MSRIATFLIVAFVVQGIIMRMVSAQPDLAVFRDRSPLPASAVAGVSTAGVQLAGTLETVGWDRVVSLPPEVLDRSSRANGASEPMLDAAGIEHSLQLGSDLWRAVHRLDRGHAIFAEASIDAYEDDLVGATGRTPALMHRSLFEARMRRGAMELALRSWLAWAYAEDLSPEAMGRRMSSAAGRSDPTDSDLDAAEDLDATYRRLSGAYGLVPAMPPVPMLVAPEGVTTLADFELASTRSLPVNLPAPRRRALVLSRLYEAVDRVERGLDPVGAAGLADLRSELASDRGVALLADMVLARIGGSDERARARDRLRARMPSDVGGWVEAWCRLGLGWSMVNEADPDLRALGVVELLHVPARFADREPYLAGLGLAAATIALERLGDSGAGRLAMLLRESYAGHPVLSQDLVRDMVARLDISASGRPGREPVPVTAEN